MNNRKFNIISILIGVALFIVLINVFYLYRRNETSKINFSVSDIRNTKWLSDDVTLSISDNNLTFIVEDEEIINESYKLNTVTGKFDLESEKEFYLRSVTKDNIIVWYNKAEYNLEKEVIAR